VPELSFLAESATAGGRQWSFEAVGAAVDALAERYRAAGWGERHRVALGVGNHPRHFMHFLALNSLGVSIVPLNPDHLAAELRFVLQHARVGLAVCGAAQATVVRQAIATAPPLDALPVVSVHPSPDQLPTIPKAQGAVEREADELAILYTSGTTGRPKGCVLSNNYILSSGAWYLHQGGLLRLERACDRLLNPLPVFHMNCGMVSFAAMLLSENCLILPDRFHPDSWWEDCVRSHASVIHYLGIMPPVLFKQSSGAWEQRHRIRFGLGAGCDPSLHGPFEERFGFPLVEVWGMTETGRFIANHHEPRFTNTRAFGRELPPLQARVVDENGLDRPCGETGELVVRASDAQPREGFFSGYLYDKEATAHAWRGNWFHTGDVFRRDAQGLLHFVDRKKDMVRRSGENISSAEVEAVLAGHPLVLRVAVVAVPDDLRDEEVMAVVVPADPRAEPNELARILVRYCLGELAYYKAPGWILFRAALPVTPTNKVQKSTLFAAGQSPVLGAVDCRSMKRRSINSPEAGSGSIFAPVQ
jgi:crotonobetaine/carnitine-CoA ligase